MQSATAFVAVSDIAQGYTEINNTPHTRRVKTVFLGGACAYFQIATDVYTDLRYNREEWV